MISYHDDYQISTRLDWPFFRLFVRLGQRNFFHLLSKCPNIPYLKSFRLRLCSTHCSKFTWKCKPVELQSNQQWELWVLRMQPVIKRILLLKEALWLWRRAHWVLKQKIDLGSGMHYSNAAHYFGFSTYSTSPMGLWGHGFSIYVPIKFDAKAHRLRD